MNEEIVEIIKEYYEGEYYAYISNNIISKYEDNDAHGKRHIYDVANRSFELNKNLQLGQDLKIILTSAFYHDIGREIDDETHELISAQIFMDDIVMKSFFTDEERVIIKESIEDHRASLKGKCRNIYGRLLSSADRNTNLEQSLKRTYLYRVKRNLDSSLEEKIRDSFEHLKIKFGENGYANDKEYFDDGTYQKYLDDLNILFDNYDLFRSKYLEVNEIDEMEYLLKNVNKDLIEYIKENIFLKYLLNDLAHNIEHIMEVIRRSFELNETLKLQLNNNFIYTIAACHDLGKYIDHETHEKIAANMFFDDENFKQFFTDEERVIIKEAIEDHRSSFDSLPRSKYGELISSADRNTSIDITFKRSFEVGKTRMPEMNYCNFLDFTFKRLGKRYGDENPENMFLKDIKYEFYLKEIRELLKDFEKFSNRYSEVNSIEIKSLSKKLSYFK